MSQVIPIRVDQYRAPHGASTCEAADCLLQAYATRSGVVSCEDLVLIAGLLGPQPTSRVAREIVSGGILTFTSRGRILAPRFQFSDVPLEVLPSVRDAMRELGCTFDDNACAAWFLHPNTWLDMDAPYDLVRTNPEQVVAAARADRWTRTGW